ncbi:MAG: cell wall hydrolase [Suipraeoptans sp.]
MFFINKKIFHGALSIVCIASLFICSTVSYAEDKQDLENKVGSLNSQLSGLRKNIDDAASEISSLSAEIEQTNLDLTAAKLSEERQYANMKSRIKFMYEGGNTSLLESLFGSKSMADFLANAEYVTTITEYDRDMLDQLVDTSAKIEEKEAFLADQHTELASLQSSLNEQLNTTNSQINNYQSQIANIEEQERKELEAKLAAEKAEQEQKAAAAAAAAEQAAAAQSSNSSTGSTSSGEAITAPTDELVLLAAILQAEAGSNYDGCIAVGTVIMNRLESSRYPGSISGVVYQSGQFSPTWNGSLNRILNNGPHATCYQAARDLLGGTRNTELAGWCTQFRTAGNREGIVIGGNVFF